MDLQSYQSILIPAVEKELHAVVDSAFTAETPDLHQMLAYHLGWMEADTAPGMQGKRIRPLLLLLCTAASGSPWQPALPAASAVELIHNFSLIHDDIQDQSPLRRGRPTVWARWGAAQAINAGDAMFSLAQLAILKLGASASIDIALAASQYLNKACISLTEGQHLDLAYEARASLTIDDYWPMISGKTAALLAASTMIGALVGHAAASTISLFEEFGHYLGLAFQSQDDLLGIWGNAALTGKSNQSDLASGKKTLPVLYGLAQNGEFSRRWKAGPIRPDEVPGVMALLSRSGAEAFTRQTAEQLTQQALSSLEKAIPSPSDASLALTALVHRLLSRQS